jgi:hypothetical protein
MSNPAGDALAARIRHVVVGRVPADQVDAVTVAACHAVITVMSDPYFLDQFRVVQELRQENAWMRTQMAILQTTLARYQPSGPKPRKAASKPRKAAAKRATAKQRQAFGQGVRDLRR